MAKRRRKEIWSARNERQEMQATEAQGDNAFTEKAEKQLEPIVESYLLLHKYIAR